MPSVSSLSLSLRATSAPPATNGTDATAEVGRTRHHEHEHHHHHDDDEGHRASRREGDSQAGQAYTTLKLKIEETFSSLTAPGSAQDPSAASSSFEGKFAASFKLSGPEGTIDATLKLQLDTDSAQGAADFASLIQGFAQTLFSALKTLYDAGPASPSGTAGLPAPASGSPSTPAPTLTNDATTPASTAAASGSPNAPTPTPAASASSVEPAASSAAPPASGTSVTSLSIKVRATYDPFGSNLGPLVNQLAQPQTGELFPQLSSMLEDLSTRFGQLLSQAPATATGASAPSLGDFLNSLSRSLSDSTTSGSATAAPAPAAAAPAASPSPAVDTPAPAADSGSTPPLSAQHFIAMAQYQQVLSYSGSGSSFSLRASVSAAALYATA